MALDAAEQELIRSLAVEILAQGQTLIGLSDQVTAALAAHRIVISAVLRETLTREQHRRVMALADRLADSFVQPGAASDVQERLRGMVIEDVALFKPTAPIAGDI